MSLYLHLPSHGRCNRLLSAAGPIQALQGLPSQPPVSALCVASFPLPVIKPVRTFFAGSAATMACVAVSLKAPESSRFIVPRPQPGCQTSSGTSTRGPLLRIHQRFNSHSQSWLLQSLSFLADFLVADSFGSPGRRPSPSSFLWGQADRCHQSHGSTREGPMYWGWMDGCLLCLPPMAWP